MIDALYVHLVSVALGKLSAASRAAKLARSDVPLDKMRKFYFARNVVWPGSKTPPDMAIHIIDPDTGYVWSEECLKGDYREWVAAGICTACRWQPRLILRAVRRIEAAARWCEARAAGGNLRGKGKGS